MSYKIHQAKPFHPQPRTYPSAVRTPVEMLGELHQHGVHLHEAHKLPDELIRKLHRLVCREALEKPDDPHGTPRQFAERIARASKTLEAPGTQRRASLLALTPLGKCVLQGRRYHRPGT